MSQNTLNETILAKECLIRLGEKESILHRVVDVLSQVAHSSVGLGEVLQDYAHQTATELQAIIRASEHLVQGSLDKSYKEVLEMSVVTLKAARTLLSMTPAAMLRNKAERLGDDKIERVDVVALADHFAHAPDVTWLLEKENSGQMLAALITDDADSSFSKGTTHDAPSFGELPN